MADLLLIVGIAILFCFLVFTLLALCFVSGIFDRVDVGTGKPPIGKVVIAYKFARGPYKECGPLFTELCAYLPESYNCLGIYYDDPKVVEPSKLRYAVGAILSENDAPVDEGLKKKLLEAGYQTFTLPDVSYVVKAAFPYRTSLSIFIAIARVYPKIDEYVKEHKLCAHPCLEVYHGSTIHFMLPLAKQNEFYVPEVDDRGSVERDFDDDEDDDESLLSASVVTGNISRDTSYMGSFVEGDQSGSDDEFSDRASEVKDISLPEDCQSKETLPVVNENDEQKSDTPRQAPQDLLCATGANFQDSGFSSEQAITPQISPSKPDNEKLKATDGNESGSSFEEISMG